MQLIYWLKKKKSDELFVRLPFLHQFNFSNENFCFIFPAVINILSKMRLTQHGAKRILTLKQYETTTAEKIIASIIHDILRKYLNSFFDSGFSGVSKGQKTVINKAAAMAKQSSIVLKSYALANFMITTLTIIESVDMISHLVSVEA